MLICVFNLKSGLLMAESLTTDNVLSVLPMKPLSNTRKGRRAIKRPQPDTELQTDCR